MMDELKALCGSEFWFRMETGGNRERDDDSDPCPFLAPFEKRDQQGCDWHSNKKYAVTFLHRSVFKKPYKKEWFTM